MSIYRKGSNSRSKKKSTFELLDPKERLRFVLGEFEDPMNEVLDILHPDHNNIVGSDLREKIEKPQKTTTGLFRVIYTEPHKAGDRPKVRSTIVEAMDGYDAKATFEIGKITEPLLKDAAVIGVECVYVPRKLKNEFLSDFKIHNETGVTTPIVEQAWWTLISNLEKFEDDRPSPDLSKFINDV